MNRLGNISTLSLSSDWTWQVDFCCASGGLLEDDQTHPDKIVASGGQILHDKRMATSEELLRDVLVQAYADAENVHLFNGPSVCLSHIDSQNKLLTLEQGQFYDFLFSNILGSMNDGSTENILQRIPAEIRDEARDYLCQAQTRSAAVRNQFATKQEQQDHICEQLTSAKRTYKNDSNESLCMIINSQKLSNAVAVSVLLRDENENYLLTQRTCSVAIGKNLWGVSASGSLEPDDIVARTGILNCKDPFCTCAAREVEEELGLSVLANRLVTTMLMIGDEKLQPIALVEGKISGRFDLDGIKNHLKETLQAQDQKAEVRSIHCVNKQQLAKLAIKHQFSQAADLQIQHALHQ